MLLRSAAACQGARRRNSGPSCASSGRRGGMQGGDIDGTSTPAATASGSSPPPLAGEYHCADFDWDDHRVACEGVLRERLASQPMPGAHEVAGKLEAQDARWESFHTRQNKSRKFFKARRYIVQEFPRLLDPDMRRVVEFGCGNGSSVVPVLMGNPGVAVTAVDFSEAAVQHAEASVRAAAGVDASRCAFGVADVAASDLLDRPGRPPGLGPAQADAVLLMFTLSAIPPGAPMARAVANAAACLRPGGSVFLRDYGMYDLAQLRFPQAQRLGGETLFHRGDGTLR